MTNPFRSASHNSFVSGESAHSSAMDALFTAVSQAIDSGAMVVGDRLPSIRAMAIDRGVSRDTVLRAYDKLVAAGRVHARRGSGFYVSPTLPIASLPAAVDPPATLDPMRLVHSDHPLDRAPGAGTLRQAEGMQAKISALLRGAITAGTLSASYGDPRGYLPLREQIGRKLTIEGLDCPASSIITIPGAIAGLGLAIRALLRPGNVAFVEDPCSFMHLSVMLAQGLEVRRVPRLADGPDLEVLRVLCEHHRPKLFLLSSVLQNPTGTSIAPQKAHRLIELAAEFGMILVDDASYADLLPPSPIHRAMPLMLLDGGQRVVHVGGFSRTVSPGLSVGFVAARGDQMRAIGIYRPVHGLGGQLLAERVLYRILSDGIYRRRCTRIHAHIARNTLAARRSFGSIGIDAIDAHDGMFLWIKLGDGVSAKAVATRMLSHGYLTAPAEHFTRTENLQNYMRFNVTTTTAKSVGILAECL